MLIRAAKHIPRAFPIKKEEIFFGKACDVVIPNNKVMSKAIPVDFISVIKSRMLIFCIIWLLNGSLVLNVLIIAGHELTIAIKARVAKNNDRCKKSFFENR